MAVKAEDLSTGPPHRLTLPDVARDHRHVRVSASSTGCSGPSRPCAKSRHGTTGGPAAAATECWDPACHRGGP
jgi:hypothetical protein